MTVLHVDGHRALRITLHEPGRGVWWADITLEDAAALRGPPAISGAVTVGIADATWQGTIVPNATGHFAGDGHVRVVGGGGGWGKMLPPAHYHSDAGVRARTVVEDAARLAGEKLGDFEPGASSLGIDYVRQAGPASRVLEEAIGAAAWWVDREGHTHVGTRPSNLVPDVAYTVLEASLPDGTFLIDPRRLSDIQVGRLMAARDDTFAVGALTARAEPESLRVRIWRDKARDRVARAFRQLVRRFTDGRLFGRYRYRVVRPSGDRLELQAVAQGLGIPDLLPIAMRPGVAGAHAIPASGSIVLVEFVEGDRAQPIVTAFAGKGEGHAAEQLVFSATTSLKLGSDAASEGVPLGTSLKSWLDGHVHKAGLLVADTNTGKVEGLSGPPFDTSPAPSSKVLVE